MPEGSIIHPFLQHVGMRIKLMRKERGFTLADLGVNIGLDKSNTHRLEQGKNITLNTVIKIAAFLGVHPKEILDVPFEADFNQIEKTITEKKKARKSNSRKTNAENSPPRKVVTHVKSKYHQDGVTTSKAAETSKKLKYKSTGFNS
jgi:transcriptional regulator with XRE-family HTH domain